MLALHHGGQPQHCVFWEYTGFLHCRRFANMTTILTIQPKPALCVGKTSANWMMSEGPNNHIHSQLAVKMAWIDRYT